MELLTRSYFGNSLMTWGIALFLVPVLYTALRILLRVLASRLRALSDKAHMGFGDLIQDLLKVRIKKIVLLVLSFYGAAQVLSLPARVDGVLYAVAFLALALQVGIWGNGIINFLVSRRAADDGEDGLNLEAYSVITWLAKATLWVLVILLILHNLGIEITALVAGLGISGIAIALAVQNILGDLFASLSIVLDRPFVIGDFIIVGEQLGTVEHVGLKTTRVRSLSGEQIIFSNRDLLESRVRNYRRMDERRVLFRLGVVYQTSREKLERIPGIIKDIIEARERVRFDRAHFSGYGNFSLDFEIVYYILDRDYNLYMDIHQDILLGIHRAFQQEGVEFAYPTQTLHLAREPAGDEADRG